MDFLSLQEPSFGDSRLLRDDRFYDDSGVFDDSQLSDQDCVDLEELEVALYSQIHFDTNLDYEGQNFIDQDSNKYVIQVEGNSKTGFQSFKGTPDIILNDQLTEKYADNVCDSSIIYISDSHNQSLLDNSVECLEDKNKEESNTSKEPVAHGDNPSPKAKVKQTDSRNGKNKSNLAEKLILGVDDSDGSDVEIISSSSEGDDSANDIEIITDDDSVSEQGETSSVQKIKPDGHFVEALSDDTDDSEYDDLYIGTTENVKKQSDIQFNIEGGVLSSDDSDQESVNEEDWKISHADTKLFNPNRYFKPVTCYNCKEKGHTTKTCKKPKKEIVCILCSEEGHISRNCPANFCYNCLEIGHNGKDCKQYRNQRFITCYRCKMEGHEAQRCPDEWRQYHLTIKPGKLVKGRPRTNAPVSRYNCGDDDHFGHECKEEGANRFVKFTTPFVCMYQQHRLYKDCGLTVREDGIDNYQQPFKKQKKEHTSIGKQTNSLIKSDNTTPSDYPDVAHSKSKTFKKPKNVSLFVPFGKTSSKSKPSERSNPEGLYKETHQINVTASRLMPDNCGISTGIEIGDRLGKRNKKDKLIQKQITNTNKQHTLTGHHNDLATIRLDVHGRMDKNSNTKHRQMNKSSYHKFPNEKTVTRNESIEFQNSFSKSGRKNKQKFKNVGGKGDSSMTKLKGTELTSEIPLNNRGFRTNLSYEKVTLNMEKNKFPVNKRGFRTNINHGILQNRELANLQITVGNSNHRGVEKIVSNVGMFKQIKQKGKNRWKK